MAVSSLLALYDVVGNVPRDEVTLDMVPQWCILGALCGSCKRVGRLDRAAVRLRFGKKAPIARLERRLRCAVCDNRWRNVLLVVGKEPRHL